MTSRELHEAVELIQKETERPVDYNNPEITLTLYLAEIAFQLALMNEERRLNTKEGNK